jgi:hypothetical protein
MNATECSGCSPMGRWLEASPAVFVVAGEPGIPGTVATAERLTRLNNEFMGPYP